MGPFELLDPEPRRRFGREPEWNAWVELHNLIAAAGGPDEFGPDDLDRIGHRRGVDLRLAFFGERLALYQRFLDDRIERGQLTEADRAHVDRLAGTLGLTPADVRSVHERAFGKAVTEAVADEHLSVQERLLLYTLQHTLQLDPDVADAAYGVLARERLLMTVARILCDGVVSPADTATVDRIRRGLGVELPGRVEAMLEQAVADWHARQPGGAVEVAAPARWRRVLAAERHAASQTPSGDRRPPRDLTEALRGRRAEWSPREGLGTIVLGPDAVRCLSEEETHIPLSGVRRVVRYTDTLFLDCGGTDWLLRFESSEMARAFETGLSPDPDPQTSSPTSGDASAGRRLRGLQLAPDERALVQGPARWWPLSPWVLEKVFSERPLRSAYEQGRTEELRVPAVALAGVADAGYMVIVPRRVFLTPEGKGSQETLTSSIRRVSRFSNGVVVERKTDSVFLDAGPLNDRVVEVLERSASA